MAENQPFWTWPTQKVNHLPGTSK